MPFKRLFLYIFQKIFIICLILIFRYVILPKTSDVPLGMVLYEHLVENLKKGDKSMANLIDQVEREYMKESVPEFSIGDTVRVNVRIKEGDKERIQAFEGVVIARKNGGVRETFTVRKISYGVGVEKTYPVHSPKIAGIEVVRRAKTRRAKLYYVRDLTGKAAKVKSADNK